MYQLRLLLWEVQVVDYGAEKSALAYLKPEILVDCKQRLRRK